MANSNIQMIMEAEKTANEMIEEARSYRHNRIKEARSEALKEIEELRHRLEDEFRVHEAEQKAKLDLLLEDIKARCEKDMQQVNESAKKGEREAIKLIVSTVTGLEAEEFELLE